MKYAVRYGDGFLSDELYDLPEAILIYQKTWFYDSDISQVIYGAIYEECDTSFDEYSARVAIGDCFMYWDRFPPEGIWSKKLAEPRGIYKLPPDDTLMSDDERRAWIAKRLKELKIEY